MIRRILFHGLLAMALLLTGIATASGQGDFATTDTNGPPPTPLPTGLILIPGAVARSSDSRTPLPETGRIVRSVYRNAYFGLSYTLPEEWIQEFSGPPPSDTGQYVLAEISPSKSFKGPSRGSILITAQDLFFSLGPGQTAAEIIQDSAEHLPSFYKLESGPADLDIANHRVTRYDYASPAAGLHWRVLATEVRCHSVQFVLTSADPGLLDAMVEGVKHSEFLAEPTPGRGGGEVPVCIPHYAVPANIEYKVEPVMTTRKADSMPVRIIIGKSGKVEHVHVISAFAEQATIITDALLQWRFKPYLVNGEPVAVETGLVFGFDRKRAAAKKSAHLD